MPTPNRALSRDVIDDVRTACQNSGRATTEHEVRRTLETLDAQQLDAVRRLARGGLTAPLGPDALVDVVQGTPVHVASARELGGYYVMKAERDALATVAAHTQGLSAPATADDEEELDEDDFDEDELDLDEDELVDAWEDDAFDEDDDAERAAADAAAQDAGDDFSDDADEADEYEPVVEEEAAPRKTKKRAAPTKESREQEQILMTLFAYHRDAVRVAQELSIGLQELADRIEELGLRRRIHRLLEQTTDIDVFAPTKLATSSEVTAPVVRRRGEKPERPVDNEEAPAATAPHTGPAAQTDPVNAHGTRVYRRSPESAPGRGAPASNLAIRREYVREPRRRARVQTPAPVKVHAPRVEVPKTPARQPFSTLQAPGGKAMLERLLADEKANPRVLAAKLAERYDGAADTRPLNDTDLRALLKAHGLADRFAQLEAVNTRFLIGFHQGARTKLANALMLKPDELDAWLTRIGLADELTRVRAERSRLELGRKRIQDRIAQVLTRAPYLDDLGVLPVIDREVQEELAALFARLGEAEAVRAELGMEPNPFAKLLRRYEGADWLPKA